MNPVLDASVFIAFISPRERHHPEAARLFASHPDTSPYLVPALFRVEVLAALARRGDPVALLDTVDAIVRGPRFFAVPLDVALLDEAASIARMARIRAYDAVYAAVARTRGAPLFTLDAELSTRVTAAFPEVRVVSTA